MAASFVYTDWLKIDPKAVPPEGPPDHYTLLRLPKFEDNGAKIQKAYGKLNKHVRGYAGGEHQEESQVLLNELAKAMLCLTDEDRKRDYDASLGREVKGETNKLGRMPMGQLLVKANKISSEQLGEAESFAEERGLELRDALVQMKLVPAKLSYKAYAKEQGYSYADLSELAPDEDVLAEFPKHTAKTHGCLPLQVDDDAVLVATAAVLDPDMEEELRLRYGKPAQPVIVTPAELAGGISRYYTSDVEESAAKAGGVKKNKAAANVPFDQLPEAERGEKRKIGIIVICWAVIVPLLGMTFLYDGDNLILFAILAAAVTGGLAAAWAFLVYWK